jgi:hypothetical protein
VSSPFWPITTLAISTTNGAVGLSPLADPLSPVLAYGIDWLTSQSMRPRSARMARSVHTYRVCRGADGSGPTREARANGGLVPLDSVEAEIAPVAFLDHPDARTVPGQGPEKSRKPQNQSRRLETMGREPRTRAQPPSSPALLGVGRPGRQRIGNRRRRGRHPGRGGRGRKRM